MQNVWKDVWCACGAAHTRWTDRHAAVCIRMSGTGNCPGMAVGWTNRRSAATEDGNAGPGRPWGREA